MSLPSKNDSQYKWIAVALLTCILSVATLWATETSKRLNNLEWNQSRVLATLEANRDTLTKVYEELKQHRQTGK